MSTDPTAATATRGSRVHVELDPDEVAALDRIEHVVVLMLENRSFDHMLGYLSLERDNPTEVRGLKPDTCERYPGGKEYAIRQLEPDSLGRKEQDPCHSGDCVRKQLEIGFVANYIDSRSQGARYDARDVMGYHDAKNVPMYDHLARHYCVCDNWFSSVPGPTLPNRRYAVAGSSGGSLGQALPPQPLHEGLVEEEWPEWFVFGRRA